MTETPAPRCAGKHCYDSFTTADRVIRDMRRASRDARYRHKERKRQIADLKPYRCTQCSHWHIGGKHIPKKVRS
jgi:hypothetical protein